MCTAAMQENLPDWMTNLDGTSVTVPGDKTPRSIGGADVPLEDGGVQVESIKAKRERLKQAQKNPGSHIPTGARTRQEIMDELT